MPKFRLPRKLKKANRKIYWGTLLAPFEKFIAAHKKELANKKISILSMPPLTNHQITNNK